MLENEYLNWFLVSTLNLLSACFVLVVLMIALYLIQRCWYRVMGLSIGKNWVYLSGFIGVPVHELSHAFHCPFFLHKINEVVLFKPDGRGKLGWVTHSYNPSNPYAVIGNFFIGIAPVAGGCLAISVITAVFLPDSNIQNVLYEHYKPGLNINDLIYLLKEMSISVFYIAKNNTSDFLIWFYLIACVSLHLAPSPSDLKGAWVGGIFFLIAYSVFKIVSDYYGWPTYDLIRHYVTIISLQLVIAIFASLFLLLLVISILFIGKLIKPMNEHKNEI